MVVSTGTASSRALTVLIAHANSIYSRSLERVLVNDGYAVTVCPIAWKARDGAHCIRCLIGSCPLSAHADLLIYDPLLTFTHDEHTGALCNAAVETALSQPDVPLLLICASQKGFTMSEGQVLETVPYAKCGSTPIADVLAQVHRLIGTSSDISGTNSRVLSRD